MAHTGFNSRKGSRVFLDRQLSGLTDPQKQVHLSCWSWDEAASNPSSAACLPQAGMNFPE